MINLNFHPAWNGFIPFENDFSGFFYCFPHCPHHTPLFSDLKHWLLASISLYKYCWDGSSISLFERNSMLHLALVFEHFLRINTE